MYVCVCVMSLVFYFLDVPLRVNRQEYGVGTVAPYGGGGDYGADGGGYEYEAKRQRLLQGGAAGSSGMSNSYYQTQPSQTNQPSFPPPSSSAAALQSSIAESLNSYFAATMHAPSTQHQGMAPPPAATYPSYNQHVSTPAVPPNPMQQGGNHTYGSDVGPGYSAPSNAGLQPGYSNSGAMGPSSAYPEPGYVGGSGRNVNPTDNAPYASGAAHVPSYAPGGSSAASPPAISAHPNNRRPPSPQAPPMPMMPFEKMSPHFSQSPSASFFDHAGFMAFAAFSRGFPVVRIRGLPFNCTESDVYDFFMGLDVVDVLLTHRQGRFSGEAYCVFGLPMQVEMALHMNRKSMGQRYIEVFRSKKHEYYLAVAAELAEQGNTAADFPPFPPPKSAVNKDLLEHTGVLRLRGLPFSASKRDVIEFFKDFNLKEENIQFVVHSDGRASGEAYVQFDGPTQSKQAMSRDKMMLGSRYIELFPSSSEESARATGRQKK
ncbi:hypothetical protein KP509_19G006800 [Ceratopteris richardii]|uniref:RRM domain-containing protein n=1 Tax=Ceratopteris richardii TaxID=49495 RepID=A0A8T2SLN5_CERRI|nr:hypothetical protein KP509_19G006800 [Ceratopteris richardii]